MIIKYGELNRIKRLHLPTLMNQRGIHLKQNGNGSWEGLCPFHNDTNPSLKLDRKSGMWLWHCFGCDAGGTVIDFVMKMDNLSFIEAIRKLKDNGGKTLKEKGASSRLSTAKKPALREEPARKATLTKLLNRVVEFYQATFKKDRRGYDYLTKQRGITDKRVFELFRVGFSNATLFTAIPQKGKIIEELKEAGILTARGRELFSGCVTIPLLDEKGNAVNIYGRKIVDGKVNHLYLPGPHRGLFNRHILKSFDEIVLTESILDSLALYSAGIKNTIPCYGTNGLTEDHVRAFREYNTRSVIILFDGDEGGRKSAVAVKECLEGLNLSCRIVDLPDGEDPASFLKAHTGEELEKLIWERREEPRRKPLYQEIDGGFLIELCQRTYVVRGIESSPSKLKATIRAQNKNKMHIDTVDLYSARARKGFMRDASVLFEEEEEIIENDVFKLIHAIEDYGERKEEGKLPHITIGRHERREAIAFGRGENLINEILRDIERCGYVGEEINKLVCYLAMTSRKMADPLAILLISGSGAGKTSLQDTILSLCPPEELVKLTSLTGKALFYKKECSLSHKVLAIEEEKGAEEAGYAIRNLISSKELTIEATIKDAYTGKMTTMENKVLGPTAVFKTTTNPQTDPETKTRFIILSIDESREQTKRILDFQRSLYTMEGYLGRGDRERIIRKHRNFQRLLKPVAVFNPFAPLLTYVDDRIAVRRDNPKYLTIIAAVTFLQQMRKPIKTREHNGGEIEYIEVTLEDIEIANQITHHVLGRSLDELTPPSRRLLDEIYKLVNEEVAKNGTRQEEVQLTRREIREYTRWSEYQLRAHIRQLVELEYLLPVAGKRGKQYRYELLYDGGGEDGSRFMVGLLPLEELRKKAIGAGIITG